MELRHLKYFLAVIDHGNYARAAADLGVSQSALTQSISGLEREVGTRLLDRGRFGAVPTEAGRGLAHRARLIVAEARVAAIELEAFRSPSRGHVTIGVGKSVVQNLIPSVLAKFLQTRPAASITALEGWSPDLYRSLLQGDLDFVVSAALPHTPVDPELVQEVLFRQKEYVLIGRRHPLTKQPALTAAQLAACRWIVPPGDASRVRMIQESFGRLGIGPPTQFLRTDSLMLLAAMIGRGDAIGLGSLDLVGHVEPATDYRIVDFPGLTTERPATLTRRRRGNLNPLAEALAQAITDAATALATQQRELEGSLIRLQETGAPGASPPRGRRRTPARRTR